MGYKFHMEPDMNLQADLKELSSEERAQKLVSYFEKKSALLEDIPVNLLPPSLLKSEIEDIFATAEEALKEIKGQE